MKEEINKSSDSVAFVLQVAIAEYNREALRLERLEQKASTVLGFVGILIALTPAVAATTSCWLLILILLLYITAAIYMVLILKPSKMARFPLNEFSTMTEMEKDAVYLGEELVSTYWNVIEESDSLISSRNDYMKWGLISLVIALLLTSVSIII